MSHDTQSTRERLTLYDLRGPWADEAHKAIILEQLNAKVAAIVATAREEERAKSKLMRDMLVSIRGEACPECCIYCDEIRRRADIALTPENDPAND